MLIPEREVWGLDNLHSLGHDEDDEGEAQADDEEARHDQVSQQPAVQRQARLGNVDQVINDSQLTLGLCLIIIRLEYDPLVALCERTSYHRMEGEERSVVSQDVLQSELSLDVSDCGDDVDDVVLVHLQWNIVT